MCEGHRRVQNEADVVLSRNVDYAQVAVLVVGELRGLGVLAGGRAVAQRTAAQDEQPRVRVNPER